MQILILTVVVIILILITVSMFDISFKRKNTEQFITQLDVPTNPTDTGIIHGRVYSNGTTKPRREIGSSDEFNKLMSGHNNVMSHENKSIGDMSQDAISSAIAANIDDIDTGAKLFNRGLVNTKLDVAAFNIGTHVDSTQMLPSAPEAHTEVTQGSVKIGNINADVRNLFATQ